MIVQQLHTWQVTVGEAQDVQRRLAAQVSTRNELASPRLIAGVDISAPDAQGIATGAAVVLSYPGLALVETAVAKQSLGFPYVPGLLSFREAPLILAACERLCTAPDLVLVDGQGIAHPRRLGLASHLGLLLDTPTIGCAKSRLCGGHGPVEKTAGSFALVVDNNEVIGAALCTKDNTKPIYVSIGHRVDLDTAISWVMNCRGRHRVPEPTRLAHLAAGGQLPGKDREPGSRQERLF